MIYCDTGRELHLVLRSLATTSIILKRQVYRRQPGSDIADIDRLLVEYCPCDSELEIYTKGALWALGLDRSGDNGAPVTNPRD